MSDQTDSNKWLQMASSSYSAALAAESADALRSAVSRYYYAAYQSATAFLRYRNLDPPIIGTIRRESWSHMDTPQMLRTHLRPFVRNPRSRALCASRLGALYKARVGADYSAAFNAPAATIHVARRDAASLLKMVQRIIQRR